MCLAALGVGLEVCCVPLVVCFRSPLAAGIDRLVKVVLPICSSWIGKSTAKGYRVDYWVASRIDEFSQRSSIHRCAALVSVCILESATCQDHVSFASVMRLHAARIVSRSYKPSCMGRGKKCNEAMARRAYLDLSFIVCINT